ASPRAPRDDSDRVDRRGDRRGGARDARDALGLGRRLAAGGEPQGDRGGERLAAGHERARRGSPVAPLAPRIRDRRARRRLPRARAVDPDALARLVRAPDVGLSAIIAAWIGVVAAVAWRRYGSRRARILDVAGCIGCALIGFAFRPDVTLLDLEHIVAFALGVAIAAWWPEEHGGPS